MSLARGAGDIMRVRVPPPHPAQTSCELTEDKWLPASISVFRLFPLSAEFSRLET
jgi:hypothetical protein